MNANQPTTLPGFESLADAAAAAVSVGVIEEDNHFPGDRQPDTVKIPDYPDRVAVDAGDCLQAELDSWEGGSHVHAADGLAYDVVIRTHNPRWVVLDEDGREILGAKLAVVYDVE